MYLYVPIEVNYFAMNEYTGIWHISPFHVTPVTQSIKRVFSCKRPFIHYVT